MILIWIYTIINAVFITIRLKIHTINIACIFIHRFGKITWTLLYTFPKLSIFETLNFSTIICALLSWSIYSIIINSITTTHTIFKIIGIIHTILTINITNFRTIIWKCIIFSTVWYTFIFLSIIKLLYLRTSIYAIISYWIINMVWIRFITY